MNRMVKCMAPCVVIAAALSGCEIMDPGASESACVEIAAGSCQPVAAADGSAHIVWQWVPAEGGVCVPPADVRYYDTPDACGQ